jgi:uncharacterized membrane protein YcaP (DUF421 family)
MDPLRIAVRIVFTYIFLMVLMRLSGKRAVKQVNPFDFTLALIIGDMTDDMMWAEVSAGMFVVATSTLIIIHTAFDLLRYRVGAFR